MTRPNSHATSITGAGVRLPAAQSAATGEVFSMHGKAGMPEVAGDHLNAARFLDDHGADLRYSPELRTWFMWTGAWWEEDRLDRILVLAADTIDRLRPWVLEAGGTDEFKRRSKHYEQSARAGRRESLLSIAGVEPEVAVAIDRLDGHPHLLACSNGTVDLRTGELRPATRSHLLTRGVNVDYDAGATSDVWGRFIAEIFDGDDELIAYVQRLLGYCLTGVVHEHVMPVLWGAGANGKSTLIGVVQDLLGDLAMTAPEGLVIRHDHDPHPERIASMRGKRMVVSAELEEKAVLAEQTVKLLTGGDTLSARELYGRRFNFSPSHKVLLVTNHRPRVRGTDHAIWRRIRLVPFNVIIPLEHQDPDLRRRLLDDHGPSVLAWLVRGAVSWHQDGLGTADAVETATDGYRRSQDLLATFLAECTVEAAGQRTKVGNLYDEWRRWCERSGERPGRKQDFAAALDETSLTTEMYQGYKLVRDLGLRTNITEREDR
jgi:putative DNA primase/helicase